MANEDGVQGVFMYGQLDDTVNVPRNEYEELLERSKRLTILEDANEKSPKKGTSNGTS